ncbi:MAG: HlyD family efflux transporter periplasmic adaptor subunit [Planctomycetes bacterium]|nr:HlyD family efflux transporter periplasmic adaptor subunit [Planctomycetota bacterium]
MRRHLPAPATLVAVLLLLPFLGLQAEDPAPAPGPEAKKPEATAEAAPAAKAEGDAEAAAAAAPAEPEAPKTHKVKKETLLLDIDLEGALVAVKPFEVRLRPKAFDGELTVVKAAPHGAQVKKGEILLQLDAADLTRSLEEAENERAKAAAELTKAEADAALGDQADALALGEKELELKVAEEALTWWREMDSKHALKNIELEVQAHQDGVDDGEEELDQLKKMYKSEDLTSATRDIVVKRAIRGLDRAKVRLGMQKEESKKEREHDFVIAQHGVELSVVMAKHHLAEQKAANAHGKVMRTAGLMAARFADQAAAKAVAKLKHDLPLLTTTAPADGVVLHGHVEKGTWNENEAHALDIGEKVAAQQVLMTLYRPGKLEAKIAVPEGQLFWVQAGMKAEVRPAALEGVLYVGTCGAVPLTAAGAGDKGQSFEVTLDLPETDARLVPGMKVEVHLEAGKLDGVLAVPNETIRHGRVKVKGADGKEELRKVELGKSDGKLTEIKSGLKEGDEVIMESEK